MQGIHLAGNMQAQLLGKCVPCRKVRMLSPTLISPLSTRSHRIISTIHRDIQTNATSETAPAKSPAKDGWWKQECPSNMKDITTIQELVDGMAEHQDRLIIVDFYAAWCNSCRSLFPKLRKMAQENPDIVILKVNFDDNKQLCKSLGIKVLPFFHLYKGAEGRVDAFTASIAKIQRLKDAIELHGAPFCSLAPPPGVPEFPEVTATISSYDFDSITTLGSEDYDQEHSNIVGFSKLNQQQQQPSAV